MNDKPVFVLRWQHLVACLVGLALWALILSPAWASGDDIELEAEQVVTTGDVTLAGDKGGSAWGFSHSLGDVDINEGANCMGSEAWGSIVVSRQTMELNPWCASLFYELNGKHEFAAKMRCDIKEVAVKYASQEECWYDQTLAPGPEPAALGALYEQAAKFDALQDQEEEHDLALARTVARQDALETRMDNEAAARRRGARQAQEASRAKAADEYQFQTQMAEQFEALMEPTGNE